MSESSPEPALLRDRFEPGAAEPLIFELGRPGRANEYFPNGRTLEEFLPAALLRDDLPLPDNSELEVVRHVTAGLTNPQIGERMFIARGTVKVHLSHIFAKLGVDTRAQLAAEATRRDIPDG